MTHLKLRYSLKEAAALLGVSFSHLRDRVAEGELETHMDGRLRFVSAAALERYVKTAEQAAGAKAA